MSEGLIQRLPPQSIQAEACVLGSMILNPDSLQAGVVDVDALWFYRPAHIEIFNKLKDMAARDISIDLVTLKDSFGDRLEAIGGKEYLVDLLSVPDHKNIAYYIDIIKDKAVRRQMIMAGITIRDMAYDNNTPLADVVGEAFSLMQIAGQQQQQRQMTAQEAKDTMLAKIESIQAGGVPAAVATGHQEMDAFLTGGGFRPGHLIVLAGGTSKGKSMLAQEWSRNMVKRGHGVLYLSGEMDAVEIMERHTVAETGVLAGRIAKGSLHQDEMDAIAGIKVSDWNMSLMDGCLTIGEIAAEAKRLNSQWNGGLSCVMVDYIGLMKANNRNVGRTEQIESMIWNCKEAAMRMQIPWLVLSQFNREGSEGRPEIWHLKHSSMVEQTANTVILLDFDTEKIEAAVPEDGGDFYNLLIRVAKQRGGMVQSWNTAMRRRLCGHSAGTREETRILEVAQ